MPIKKRKKAESPQLLQGADLRSLMDYIGYYFVFMPDVYPRLRQARSKEEKLLFALGHSVFHLNKSLGKIAAEAECADHGGGISKYRLDKAVVSHLVSTLKLMQALGISAEEICRLIPAIVKPRK